MEIWNAGFTGKQQLHEAGVRSGYGFCQCLKPARKGVRVLVPAVVEAWTKPHAPDTSVDVRETAHTSLWQAA